MNKRAGREFGCMPQATSMFQCTIFQEKICCQKEEDLILDKEQNI